MIAGFAQEDSKKYREKDLEQFEMYEDGDYLFPPKPRNNWSIGVKGGLAFVAGDVKPQPGVGFGLDVRKALGHAFSLRLQTSVGRTHGLNFQPANGYRNHDGNPWDELYFPGNVNQVDPLIANPPNVYYNFRMQYVDVALQGLVNLNNINFYKEQTKWNIYAGAGIGGMIYNTSVDALDANDDVYAFFDEVTAIPLNNSATPGIDGRKQRIDLLKSQLDGVYETPAEGHSDEEGITIGGRGYIFNPMVTATVGIRYRLSRRIEIELEHRLAWSNDDLLDGQRWQEAGGGGPDWASDQTALTRDFDSYNYTTIGLHFRLGPGEESLWWSNPLTEVYSSAQEARTIAQRLTEDSDQDGVPDLYDKEPDTPEGVQVDAWGRAQDLDGDGVLDNEDEEPFTPKGCDVDQYGRAIDSDKDGVPDCYDKEPNSKAGMYYDANGVAIIIENNNTAEFPCLLPVIHFELDKDAIKAEFYPELYYIAQVMRNDPTLKVRATGHADVRNTDTYNEDLSRRRVQNAVDFIVNTYGIDASRFVLQYQGEKSTLIKNLPDNHANRKLEPLHYVNRRVEFECVK
ncbi:MAG: hypothetical protein OHK0039_40200 [Bacteroidia bacterium]